MEHTDIEPFPTIDEDTPITDAPPTHRTTISATAGDENFSERSPERTALLRKFEVILDEVEVPVPFWAFCQLANIGILENLLRQIAAAPDIAPFAIQSCFVVPRLWAQKPPQFSENVSVSSSDASSRSSGRSRRLAELARERDGGVCILSKSGPCDVAHIFAHCLLKPKKKQTASDRCVPTIWSVLFLFWPKEQVEKWKRCIFHGNSNETTGEDGVFNLICLRPDLQRAWAQGRFALRPVNVSDDMKTMNLEFHWMPRYSHTYDSSVPIVQQPLSTRNMDRVEESFIFRESGERVISGSIFTITTPDPVRLPLPSFDLLEMAWHLSRIVSMSASGLPDNLDLRFEGDDDDDIKPMAVPDHVMDWIIPPQTPSSKASSVDDRESSITSTNPSPVKTRSQEVTDAAPSGQTLEQI